jgi:hypothetical protein
MVSQNWACYSMVIAGTCDIEELGPGELCVDMVKCRGGRGSVTQCDLNQFNMID